MMKGAGMVVEDSMSNLTSGSNDATISSGNRQEIGAVSLYPQPQPSLVSSPTNQSAQPAASKKKRNLPGNPDPEAEVVALSPRTLVTTNRFVCEVCNKGFQRDQNLQLHRRGHNLPWKLKQRSNKEVIRKKVYICPETTCIHHDPSRALGDLTGIKKHFSRKHGEKKWKCEKCSKRYAVQSDWKAHSKICGTREYRCDCGTLFSRRDSFITHRAFCDALAVESSQAITSNNSFNGLHLENHQLHGSMISLKPEQLDELQDQPQQSFNNLIRSPPELPPWLSTGLEQAMNQQYHRQGHENASDMTNINSTNRRTLFSFQAAAAAAASSHMSATALLQKAAQMGVTASKPAQEEEEEEAAAVTAGVVAPPHQATHPISATAGLMSSTSFMRVSPTTDHDHHHGGVLMGMVNSQLGFEGSISPFGVENFQGMLLSSSRRNNNVIGSSSDEGGVVGGRGNNKVNNDGLTRDFLGLKAFPPPPHPPRGFLNLDDLHQINASSFNDQQNHHNPAAPW